MVWGCSSWARERHIALQAAFRIENRLDLRDLQPGIVHLALQHAREMRGTLRLGDPGKQLGVHEKDGAAFLRGDRGDAAGGGNPRLVAEPVTRRQKNKSQDERDN